MKKVMISAAVLMSMTLSFVACKKNDKPTNTTIPGPYTTINSAFADVAPKSKTVTINATSGASFYGNSGTRYIFYPNSFVDAAGALVSGNIDIQVLECTSVADMIFGQMLPMSNGNPLISAGEINVSATQSGAPIYIRPGYVYEVKMPTNKGAATAGMEYFTGAPSTSIKGSTVNWNMGIRKDSLSSIVYNGDTISMFPDSVGMKNLDKYASTDFAIINLKIDGISGTLDEKDLFTYFKLDGLLSAVSIYSSTPFVSNTYTSVKILKSKTHLVACTVYGGDFYGGVLNDVMATDGTTYTLTVSKMTPTAFKTMIDALK